MSFLAPPGYQPIYSPSIPYLGPVYGGLRHGVSIYIQGYIAESINRFFVNLLCGESESSDVAFHFNPRFDLWDKVVFNSCQNGCWGSEEKIHRMPFYKGQAFEMMTVNGNEFHTFHHRVPMESICAMHISGDVSIQTINIIGGGMGGGFPGPMMGGGMIGGPTMGGGMIGGPMMGGEMMVGGMGGGYPGGFMGGDYPGGMGFGMGGGFPGSNLPGMGGQPVYNPTVPFSTNIPGGMFSKRTIIIRGMVPYGAERIGINFIVSRSRDIAFHRSPRVREGIVVRNSMIGGSWGQEDRELSFNPFMEGQYFDLSIRCGNRRFKVFVNGQHSFDFHHRLFSFHEVDMLEIDGNVQISYIHI